MSAFDPEELLARLAEGGVVFVVVGNTASVIQGAPVMTMDLDVVIEQSGENYEAVADVLTALHARPLGSTRPAAPIEETVLMGAGVNRFDTDAGPLDVMMHLTAVGSYADLEERAEQVTIRGHTVLVARLEDVIVSKEAADRDKDRATLHVLRAALVAREKDTNS